MIRLHKWRAFLMCAGFAAIIASFALFAVQAPTTIRPLMSNEDFANTAKFLRFWPDSTQDFLTDKTRSQATFLTNLRLDHGQWVSFAGTLETSSFRPSLFMMMPLIGPKYMDGNQRFNSTDVHVALVCIANGRTKELIQAPTGDWFEKVFAVPRAWCGGPIRITAATLTSGVEFGVGTPFRVSQAYWIASQKIGICAAAIVAFMFVSLNIAPFLMIGHWCTLTRSAISILYLCGCGYLTYMLSYAGVGHVILRFLVGVQITAPTVIAVLAIRRIGTKPDFNALLCWVEGNVVIVGLMVLPYFVLPDGNGSWFPNHAFDPAGWSTDNHLPVMMAKFLQFRGAGRPPYLGPWSITDRGIAPAGTVSDFIIFMKMLGIYNNNPISYIFLSLVQSIVQGAIIPLFLIIFRNEGWTRRRRVLFFFTCLTTPFVFFNIFYVWPKLIAGGLGILSILLFGHALRRWQPSSFILAILCFGMATLCHSASLLAGPAVVAFVATMFIQRVRSTNMSVWMPTRKVFLRSFGAILIATTITAAMIFSQDRLAPKTSYATTFLLTGQGVFDLDTHQVKNLIVAFYQEIAWKQWIDLKFGQLKTLFWVSGNSWVASYCVGNSDLSCLRGAEFFCLFPALGIAPLLLVGRSLINLVQRNRSYATHLESDVVKDMRLFAVICFAFILVFILPFNAPMIVHQMPYILVLGMLAGSLTLIRQERDWLSDTAVVLQVFNLLVVWFIGAWIAWYSLIGS